MIFDIDVRVRGLPEGVQRIADELDLAFPGRFEWHALPTRETDRNIRLIGSAPTSARPRRQELRRKIYKAHLRSIDTKPILRVSRIA